MPFDQVNFELPVITKPSTPAELMATPAHMLAWLRSKRSTDVVAIDMMSCHACLGATFLQENGFPRAMWATDCGYQEDGSVVRACAEIGTAIMGLLRRRSVTAAAALSAFSLAGG